jgi:hypothetical protein
MEGLRVTRDLSPSSALRVKSSISGFFELASQSLDVPEVIEVVVMMIVAEKHNIEAQRVGRFRKCHRTGCIFASGGSKVASVSSRSPRIQAQR